MGSYVVSGSADATCRIWGRSEDGSRHDCLAVLVGHRGPIRCVGAIIVVGGRFGEDGNGSGSEDGCSVCSGSLDGVLKQWRVAKTTRKWDGGSQCSSIHGDDDDGGKYFEL